MPRAAKPHRTYTKPTRQPRKQGTAAQRGYGSRWTRASRAYRKQHPWCMECLRLGKTMREATSKVLHVDHIVPHKGDMELFWDRRNWQTLCEECHGRKSAGEK